MMALLIILLVVGALLIGLVMQYNKLVSLRNQFKNAFAQIDVQLQRRFDLIPNLVETAKGYLAHEQQTLQAVVDARNTAKAALDAVRAETNTKSGKARSSQASTSKIKKLGVSQGALDQALSRLMVVVEAYPDLKANQNMMQLTEELTATENKVAFARQAYNDSVMSYNTQRESFPSSILASTFDFEAADLLTIEEAQRATVSAAPKVSF